MKKFLAMTAAALLATTTFASAATLSFVTVGGDFNSIAVTGSTTVVYTVKSVEHDEGVSENYLTLGGPTETLISENGILNAVRTRTITQGAATTSALRFIMGSFINGFAANNRTGVSTGFSDITFSSLFNGGKSVIAYFEMGDDAGFDELSVQIDIDTVPVPAAGLLLLSGLGGLGLMRRRSKKA